MVTVQLVNRRHASGSANVLWLTADEAGRLGVKPEDVVTLHLGAWRDRFRCTIRTRDDASRVILPARAPRLPVRTLQLYRTPEGALRLGPIIGIMTLFRATRAGLAGSQMPTYIEVMRRVREAGGFAFVFRPATIRRRQGRSVRGWTRINRRWIPCRMPTPDVVYNRVQSRPAERRLRARGLLRRLQNEGAAVFNPHYLNKWTVHRQLVGDPEVHPFLPETRRFRSTHDAAVILRRYGRAFLKPSGGSLGLGAAQVLRGRDGRLSYRMNTMSGRSSRGTLRNIRHLARVLPPRRDYLVQRGIQLARVFGRPFDVRALVQKDADGQWRFTGAAARIAGRGRITTHVPRGGTRRPLKQVLEATFGSERIQEIVDKLQEACLKSAIGLEKATKRMFGELSLDVGIDRDGEVWILEMNAKPFRFDEPHLRIQAQRRLVRFASSLAGYRMEIPEDAEAPIVPLRRSEAERSGRAMPSARLAP